jgi:hypothetical protein
MKNIFTQKNLPYFIGAILIIIVILYFISNRDKDNGEGQPDPGKLNPDEKKYQTEIDAIRSGINVDNLSISKAEAINIANGLENAMWCSGSDDAEVERLLEVEKFGQSTYPFNGDDLKLIYTEFGLRKGCGWFVDYTSLGEWFADDLDDSPRLLDKVKLIFADADIRF